MHGFLDVAAVEVDGCALRLVDEFGWEGKYVPEKRALGVRQRGLRSGWNTGTYHSCDFVDVETWIRIKRGEVDQIEYITVLVSGVGVVEENRRLHPGRWESEIFFDVVRVAAGLVQDFQPCDEGFVKVEKVVVRDHEWHCWNFFLNVVELADARVIYERTREVEVFFVVFVKHCG